MPGRKLVFGRNPAGVAGRLAAAAFADTTAAQSIRGRPDTPLRFASNSGTVGQVQSATEHQDESKLTVPRGTRSSVQGAVRFPPRQIAGLRVCRLPADSSLSAPLRGFVDSAAPKVFHALQFLIEHRDRTVTKDELCDHVGPINSLVTNNRELYQTCPSGIGDDGRGQKLIQTRKGFGYRFVGKVEEQSAPTPPEAIAETLARSIEEPPQGGAAEPSICATGRTETRHITRLHSRGRWR